MITITPLFWLYWQLQNLQGCFAVVIPFQGLKMHFNSVASLVMQCPSDSRLVLLMDLLTPSLECREQTHLFLSIFAQRECTVMIAQSSSFGLFCTLKPLQASDWLVCELNAKNITLKPFTDYRDRMFLCSLLGGNVAINTITSMVQYCKGIPQLLAMCRFGVESYKTSITMAWQWEFLTVMNYMRDCPTSVLWNDELNLLVAARFKMNISHLGLNRESSAQNPIMCVSHPVHVNENVPMLYFPSDSHKSSS